MESLEGVAQTIQIRLITSTLIWKCIRFERAFYQDKVKQMTKRMSSDLPRGQLLQTILIK